MLEVHIRKQIIFDYEITIEEKLAKGESQKLGILPRKKDF